MIFESTAGNNCLFVDVCIVVLQLLIWRHLCFNTIVNFAMFSLAESVLCKVLLPRNFLISKAKDTCTCMCCVLKNEINSLVK